MAGETVAELQARIRDLEGELAIEKDERAAAEVSAELFQQPEVEDKSAERALEDAAFWLVDRTFPLRVKQTREQRDLVDALEGVGRKVFV